MSSVTIIDNHSGYHGKYVTECVKENWDGQINKIDLGSNRVNISEIVECLNEAADKVET
ncbi:MAG: hypothetical protein K9L74_07680 [Candidatus Izimaplasma sp.]|nr:hypothetical protein [Candidatus Izimaplasma bacterium]